MNLLLHEGIQSRSWLVEDQQLGFSHECLHEAHLLLVALRKRSDRPVELQVEPVRQGSNVSPRRTSSEVTEMRE